MKQNIYYEIWVVCAHEVHFNMLGKVLRTAAWYPYKLPLELEVSGFSRRELCLYS
jgi:hypothetical protein